MLKDKTSRILCSLSRKNSVDMETMSSLWGNTFLGKEGFAGDVARLAVGLPHIGRRPLSAIATAYGGPLFLAGKYGVKGIKGLWEKEKAWQLNKLENTGRKTTSGIYRLLDNRKLY